MSLGVLEMPSNWVLSEEVSVSNLRRPYERHRRDFAEKMVEGALAHVTEFKQVGADAAGAF